MQKLIKPPRKEIVKPPLYFYPHLASTWKSAPGPKTPTPSTTTKQLTPASSQKISRSIATAKYTGISPVLHSVSSHEDPHPLRRRQKITSHGEYIHRIHQCRPQHQGLLDSISRRQWSTTSSLYPPAASRHLPQLVCRRRRLRKGSRQRRIPIR